VYQQLCAHFGETGRFLDGTAAHPSCFHAWDKCPQFASKKILGKEKCCPQPSGLLPNGTVISLF
ncbi:MAG: hypothetical protein RQ714_09130, partial [Nitrosomonas sp.]|nr:hypothetical protein [Nitrosomonas sp.]